MQTILSVQNLTFNFPTEDIFDDITFSIYEKDRVAFIGANGTGKTTLIKLILGKEAPNKGSITLLRGLTIGYLSQEVIQSEDNTLYEEALLVFKELIQMEKDLQLLEEKIVHDPTNQKLIDEYGKKQHAFLLKNGYDYPYLIDMMLSKFGFKKEEYNRKINTFSGGEKTKMSFAKLLLSKPDLLILDEPTNHLDLSTIEWLEDYLKSYEGTLIFVSHDRYFINNLANKIYEIENHHLSYYKGNYDYYIHEKKVRYETQLKAYNNQQKEINKMKRFIEFFMPKPRFVSRAKDRINKLNHMKLIDKPLGEEKPLKINFKGEALLGKKIIGFEHVDLGYSKNDVLINDVNALVLGKDRLAIMGDNGTGKTTVLKYIMSTLSPLQGQIVRYRDVNIGYIDQHHFDIKGSKTLVEDYMEDFPYMGEKNIYNHLGKFNFSDDDFFKTLDMLSGGEKMRLVLSKIILRDYDLLLLDEPTNHLDIITKQALIRALDDYEGTIIFVSHDRHFVDEIANKILYFHDHKSYFHDGNYQDFKEIEQGLFNLEPKQENKIEKKVDEKPLVERKRSSSTSRLEDKISKIEGKINKLKKFQFEEEVYSDSKKMKEIDEQLALLEEELLILSEEYLERE